MRGRARGDRAPADAKKRGGWADAADGCFGVLEGGCCVIQAFTVVAVLVVPLLLLR